MSRLIGRRRLLELDPELGRLLEGERLQAAQLALTVRTIAVPVGEWDISGLGRVAPANLGLLIVDGVIARELSLGATVSSELLGPGDLVRPWGHDEHARLVASMTYWNVLSTVRVALLDRAVTSRLGEFPEVTAMVVDRLSARTQRLVMLQAIAHLNRVDARLEAVLWLLADRWGRMTADGVVVPLVLSHRAMGQLVGAARPTVSTAFSSLALRGAVARRSDGTWWLNPDCRPSVDAATVQGIRQRRHLLPVNAPEQEAADWMARLAS